MSSPRFRNQDTNTKSSKVWLYRDRLYSKLSTAKQYRSTQINQVAKYKKEGKYPRLWQDIDFNIYEGTVRYEKVDLDDN